MHHCTYIESTPPPTGAHRQAPKPGVLHYCTQRHHHRQCCHAMPRHHHSPYPNRANISVKSARSHNGKSYTRHEIGEQLTDHFPKLALSYARCAFFPPAASSKVFGHRIKHMYTSTNTHKQRTLRTTNNMYNSHHNCAHVCAHYTRCDALLCNKHVSAHSCC